MEFLLAGLISAVGTWVTNYYIIEPYFPQNEKQQISYLNIGDEDE
jgi:hypothetical protein